MNNSFLFEMIVVIQIIVQLMGIDPLKKQKKKEQSQKLIFSNFWLFAASQVRLKWLVKLFSNCQYPPF